MTFDFLKDNLIIICSNEIKLKIIKYCVEKAKVFNIKYFTIDEFVKNLTYYYDEKTILNVMNEFNLTYDVTKNYLDNIKFLIDENKEDKRIEFLREIKDFCEKNNLLIKNRTIKHLIKNRDILLIGYDYINNYYRKVFDLNNIKYNVINLRNDKKTCVINEFSSMEDEIHFVANRILDLVEKGIDINKIYVSNVNDNYNYLINKIFKLYNLPFNAKKRASLYETLVGKYFLDNLSDDVHSCIDALKDKFKNSANLINMIIDILNKYSFVENISDIKEVLVSELKNTKLDVSKYDKAINIIELRDNIVMDDEHIFLLGFNLNVIPKTYKNEEYFSDEIKFSYMETTKEKNEIEKKIWKKIISSIENIYISYSLNYLSENFYPSSLIEDANLEVKKNKREISKYSNNANMLLMSDYLDDYYKYGKVNENLKDLLATYENNYNSYDNKFKGIKNFSEDIVLSYSSMNNYYKCAFRYYLSNVLKIDIYNENFSQYIGNLFHYSLQHYYGGIDNIEELYDKYILNNKYDFSEKEKHFISVLKEELKFIIKGINRHNELSSFKDLKLEEKFVINDGNNVFKGFIDKILYKDKNIVIIDYKTGSIDIDLSLVPHGLSLQLPVYLYLAKKTNMDAKIVGFYLQHILNGKMRRVSGKSYETLKKYALKLQGYSLGDETILSEFDESFRDSEVIKGMKLGKNGFYHYTKVLSESEMDRIYNVVEDKIKDAFVNINCADFRINPKNVKGKNIGCEFCSFRDICFMNDKDNVYLEVDENSSYLGGDSNA